MNIDVTALKAVEREKGIPADTVIEAIESALVTAYRHADGAAKHVRVHVDRKSGEVAVLAQELGPDGEVVREWDDTPSDFGRIAASTAKQVIVQRLRDAEHEQTFGEYAGKEGDIVSGIVQAHDRRNVQGTVLIDIGKVEAVLPQSEQVPGEAYTHGSRIKAYVVSVARTFRGPQVTVSAHATRTWCASCSRSRCPRSPTAASRSSPSPARPGTGRRSPSAPRWPGSTPRAPASARWGSGCATS